MYEYFVMDNKTNQLEELNFNPLFENHIKDNTERNDNLETNNNTKDVSSVDSWYSSFIFFDATSCFECCCKCCCLICLPSF